MKSPLVRSALLMLDWDKRPIEMRVPGYAQSSFRYEKPMLVHALSGKRHRQERPYKEEEIYMREAFDELFSGLDRFSCFLDLKLIKKKDLAPYLEYWLDAIGKVAEEAEKEKIRQVMLYYIKDYEFNGVVRLLREFGHEFSLN